MPDLLFEIGSEELPSWYVSQGRRALEATAVKAFEEARLHFGTVESYGTPRRLAILVRDLAEESERRSEKRRGPPESAAFDSDGSLSKAGTGFAESSGVDPSELVVEETDRGRYLFATREAGGEAAARLLPGLLQRLVEELPAPRKMRWGEVETGFVRPVSWLVALLGDQVIGVEAAGRKAGRTTLGHRFLAPEPIELRSPVDYLPALRNARVLADEEERRQVTRAAVEEVAVPERLAPVEDEALLSEVANLVEVPFAVMGRFDDEYLELPDEVLATVMIHHQRFFPLRGEDGRLAARFVAVSNNEVPDVAVVRSGYEKVLAGRLYDARFFWEADRSKSLSQHAWELSGIQFHRKLGSMADKVARVDQVARTLAGPLCLSEEERATLDRALPIFRADLGTDMVFEFPDLEGVMARAYAQAEGLGADVGTVLEDGVKPQGPDEPLPGSRVGALLSAVDRLDKLLGFMAVGLRGSGSADPYGLRRDALGLVRILNAQGWELSPRELLEAAAPAYEGAGVEVGEDAVAEVERFLWDRVASLLGEEGHSVHVVRAVCADSPPVIVAARRARLLRALAAEPEFPDLLTLYKRAANLGEKAEEDVPIEPDLFSADEEQPLYDALPIAREGIDELMDIAAESLPAWDLARPSAARLPSLDVPIGKVLSLKAPLDSFLDDVLVMVDDDAVRKNRLALLREVRDAMRAIGRLEELEGA